MTSNDFTKFTNLYRFPTGRRLFALGRVRDALKGRKLKALEGVVNAALASDRSARVLELRWRSPCRPRH